MGLLLLLNCKECGKARDFLIIQAAGRQLHDGVIAVFVFVGV
jgi:hypothetical protein